MATEVRAIDSNRRPYRLSADRFELMIETVVIPENDDAEPVEADHYKMVKKEIHEFTVGQVADSLRQILPDGSHVREAKSLRHGKRGLPEPDVAVLSARVSHYRPQPPSTSEVALIAEVCHYTRKADYENKFRAYASAGVPAYWIVDLHLRRVEVFTLPHGRGAGAAYLENESCL